ncbi:MAG: Do family serine endopeptidase [Planctomycetes bacterium]|nr:Do family serine endopeptidase [Planctomycetota bacterium]
MNTLGTGRNRLLVWACGICLLGAVAVVAQRRPVSQTPVARDAQELSRLFRSVSKAATPSVVSIEVRGKPIRVRGNLPFGDNELFRELFKNDPRFREFQNQSPEERELPAPVGRGSGFIIDESGVIVTNSHVVNGAEHVKVTLHDGREFTATDIKQDPRSDIAILHIDVPGGLKAVRFGNSDLMQVGDWVLAIGSPFEYDLSVTAGIISAKGRGPRINEREDYLQTDAAINPGNSGGPLLNLNGEVIGINTAISSRNGSYNGIGFAVPINMAQWVIDQLVDEGKVTRAYLGVKMQEINAALARSNKISIGQGVIVAEIMSDSPAAESELQELDVILELDGKKVTSPKRLQAIVEKLTVDKTYQMTVLRDGRRMKLDITVRPLPESYSLLGTIPRPSEPKKPEKESFDDLGLEVEELTPEIQKQLNLKDATGVLVRSVKVNSPAQRAGIRTLDIIEKVGSTRVTSPKEFREAIKKSSLPDGIRLLVRDQSGKRVVVIEAE